MKKKGTKTVENTTEDELKPTEDELKRLKRTEATAAAKKRATEADGGGKKGKRWRRSARNGPPEG